MKALAGIPLALWCAVLCSHGCDSNGATGSQGRDDIPARKLAPRVVQLSEAAVKRNEIRVAPARKQRLHGDVLIPAEVRLDPDRTAHVASLVEGQLTNVRAALGQQVKKGEVLAVLKSVALGQVRSELEQQRAAMEVAKADLARQQELQQAGIGAKRRLLEAQGEYRRATAAYEAAKQSLGVYGGGESGGSGVAIRSPITGTVVHRNATPGEIVSPQERLFTVADISRVWVVGKLYEHEVAAAKEGRPAVVHLQAYPDKQWSGTVDYVASTLDPNTRALDVRVELDNPEAMLKPGLFGSIAVAADIADAGASMTVAAVPEQAVQQLNDGDVVFVPQSKPGVFRAVDVRVAGRRGEDVQVASGIQPGDAVVVSGAFTLKSVLLQEHLSD